jgi:hypothetical protein
MTLTRIALLVGALLALGAVSAAPAAAQDQELVFHSLTPCRVVDSRSGFGIATGPLTPGVKYDVTFRNKCRIPGLTNDGGIEHNTVAALALNIVAVGPAGPGHLLAWPANKGVPTASAINYSNVGGLNIANGVIVSMCDQAAVMPFPCQSGDISFVAAVSTTHLVVDVAGYFMKSSNSAARRYGVTGVDEHLCINTNAGVRIGLSRQLARWDTADRACPAGTWVCSAFERGGNQCDTARPDSFIDGLKCDGTSLDYPPDAHRGWLRNASTSHWGGMATSEAAGGAAETIAGCVSLPVWCCSAYPSL